MCMFVVNLSVEMYYTDNLALQGAQLLYEHVDSYFTVFTQSNCIRVCLVSLHLCHISVNCCVSLCPM